MVLTLHLLDDQPFFACVADEVPAYLATHPPDQRDTRPPLENFQAAGMSNVPASSGRAGSPETLHEAKSHTGENDTDRAGDIKTQAISIRTLRDGFLGVRKGGVIKAPGILSSCGKVVLGDWRLATTVNIRTKSSVLSDWLRGRDPKTKFTVRWWHLNVLCAVGEAPYAQFPSLEVHNIRC
ncbi:g11263 [Coccomyxa elongata]